MKLRGITSGFNRTGPHGDGGAFTLPELMIAMAVFSLLIGGLISTQIMGLRMDQLARSKIGASADARAAISRMVMEIRSAGLVRIGAGNLSQFNEAGVNQRQEGNAIQVYPEKNATNRFIRYYYDPADETLRRTEDGATSVQVVANSVRNQGAPLFTSEDFSGTVLSNNFNNRVIGVRLEFFQLQNPTFPIGPESIYDFYQFRTKITRRALE
ncbi:MAG: prepilin-type N-terminal cleavage/methylation domain-containing protein [Verrucomicrobia bacterium]|jgi:prepilin-type N-terminal cleavage/methylation domain-containing protein|nr:prepilin-type N-terminal cleavage/methylation domain-containing protein [Verrucomicrobiota bacterium]